MLPISSLGSFPRHEPFQEKQTWFLLYSLFKSDPEDFKHLGYAASPDCQCRHAQLSSFLMSAVDHPGLQRDSGPLSCWALVGLTTLTCTLSHLVQIKEFSSRHFLHLSKLKASKESRSLRWRHFENHSATTIISVLWVGASLLVLTQELNLPIQKAVWNGPHYKM